MDDNQRIKVTGPITLVDDILSEQALLKDFFKDGSNIVPGTITMISVGREHIDVGDGKGHQAHCDIDPENMGKRFVIEERLAEGRGARYGITQHSIFENNGKPLMLTPKGIKSEHKVLTFAIERPSILERVRQGMMK